MVELKTKKNSASVAAFLSRVQDDEQRADSKKLVKIFTDATKEQATMWGKTIVGFGSYHYKSARSSQEGDWPLVGFSPRKQNISLYIMPGFKHYQELLKKLGKHKTSTGCCLYIKRLADVDSAVLKQLIKRAAQDMKKKHKD